MSEELTTAERLYTTMTNAFLQKESTHDAETATRLQRTPMGLDTGGCTRESKTLRPNTKRARRPRGDPARPCTRAQPSGVSAARSVGTGPGEWGGTVS